MRTNPYGSAEYRKNRQIILDTNNHICHYCGGEADTADHIIPVSKGGGHELSNLLPACKSCNSSRQDKTIVRMRYWNKRYV